MQTPAPSTFNGFDWFLVIVLVMSTLLAFRRGIIKVLFSLGGLILGIVAGAWYYEPVARGLTGFISSYGMAQVIAFLLIASVVMVLCTVVAGMARKTVKAIGLGIFDRLLGAVFGFLRGCLLGAAALMAIMAFVPDSAIVKNSQLAPYFLAGAHTVSFVVPEHFQQQVAAGAAHFVDSNPDLLKVHRLEQPKD